MEILPWIKVSIPTVEVPDQRRISGVENYVGVTVVDSKPPLSNFRIVVHIDHLFKRFHWSGPRFSYFLLTGGTTDMVKCEYDCYILSQTKGVEVTFSQYLVNDFSHFTQKVTRRLQYRNHQFSMTERKYLEFLGLVMNQLGMDQEKSPSVKFKGILLW